MKLRYLYYKIKEKIFCHRFKNLKQCNLPYRYYDEHSRSEKWVFYRNNHFTYYSNLEYALGDLGRCDLIYHVKTKVQVYPKREKIDIIHFHEFDSVIQALYNNPESFSIPKKYLHEYSEQQLNYLKTIQSFLKIIGLKDTKSSKCLLELEEKYDKLSNEKSIIKKIKSHFLWYKLKKLSRQDRINRSNNTRAKEFENHRPIWKNPNEIEELLKGKIIYKIYKYPNKNKKTKYLILKENEYVGIAESIDENKIKFKELKENMIDKGQYQTFKEYKNLY